MKALDGIDWVPYTSGSLHVAENPLAVTDFAAPRIVYARILPATVTRKSHLFNNEDLHVWGHYSTAKDKLVGYSVVPRVGATLYAAGPTVVGIFFDPSAGDHTVPEIVFDESKLKLYRFLKGDVYNYAVSLRGK